MPLAISFVYLSLLPNAPILLLNRLPSRLNQRGTFGLRLSSLNCIVAIASVTHTTFNNCVLNCVVF